MPLFRRRTTETAPLTFTVGVGDHRVAVGAGESGCRILDDIDEYAQFIERREAKAGARDTVGLLNAKLDYAELVDTTVSVLVLTFEELVERGIVAPEEAPKKPALPPLPRDISTYDYIQEAYQRARRRCEWAKQVDSQLHALGVAVLWPET
jgi:hypothetical protein